MKLPPAVNAELTSHGRRRQATTKSALRIGFRRIGFGRNGVGLRRRLLIQFLALQLGVAASIHAASPTFENRTPVGFSVQESLAKEDFVEGQEVTVRVDLNQAATPTHPVIGHFHNIERSETLEDTDVDGLRADVAVSNNGVIHTAWISQEVVNPVTTPVYYVRYARSSDQGKSFTSPVSVSGTLRFDLQTVGSSFSTLDLEVDSRGNPRIVYAMNHSPDGQTAAFSGNPDNVYFNYSEDAGASWLPGNDAVIVNDVTTVATEGLLSAYPRMSIDQRDNIFIAYVRGTSLVAGDDDVMLAKVNRGSSPFSMEQVGPSGNSGSSGGVRIAPGVDRHVGPDMAVGTGDVLHIIYYNESDDNIEHKTLLADDFTETGVTGWDQDVDGAVVDGFDNTTAGNTALEQNAIVYFPTIVVDQQSSPDEVYALYKFGDNQFETIFFNSYTYDNAIGPNASWVAGSASPVWSTANTVVFADDTPFWNVELDWELTERVAAVVDDRLPTQGEIHIAFTAGFSGQGEHDIYYGYYNGVTWTLPEKVTDDDSDPGTEDGIATSDVYLVQPAIAKAADSENIYMVFGGGDEEGMGSKSSFDANHHAYFKVLGRTTTSEDVSVPVGGFQYNLAYTPTNPHAITTELADNPVWVHVADNSTGIGLGATATSTDGFLAGDWETVGPSLVTDDDKNFEGKINEDTTSGHEWGDDDDKIGLLVKLNILGSDSATNVQVVVNSTASDAGTGVGARSIRVGTNPQGAVVIVNDFFLLGADIDIIDSNTGPTVSIQSPDGVADTANTSFIIHYSLTDPDDDISTVGLKPSLYASRDSTLQTVQDIRIFGTLIANQNDSRTVFANGTNDFLEGTNQTYTWRDPSSALKDSLFASIHQVLSGDYYIYLVADDQKNPPVFARSPGTLTVLHKPIVDHVDPSAADTVDSGIRTGENANPYDLDFAVRDFDLQGTTQVQLFFSAVSGLASVSVKGVFPSQKFALGKSVSGYRSAALSDRLAALSDSDTLTSADSEFSWDIQKQVCQSTKCLSTELFSVAEGAYFIYLVANDSVNTVIGQSSAQLIVKHSPSFTFYEPPKDTHRKINTRSQPVYTIQWQKGSGDKDFDDDATIDLYFTTDNPATINYEDFPDSLVKDADTRTIKKGIGEDGDRGSDMFVWDLTNPPNDVPKTSVNGKVWLYAIISDGNGNSQVSLGGALSLTHEPHITLLSAELDDYGSFQINDVLRFEWDDYLVDDGSSTDNAYIRLYASPPLTIFSTLAQLETDVGLGNSFLLNSLDGTGTGAIQPIREDSSDFFDWNTRLFGTAGTYHIYAGISADATFNDNSGTTLSRSTSLLTLAGTSALPHISISPSDQTVAVGDTLTMDVMVQHPNPVNLVQAVIELNDNSFSIVDQGSEAGTQPFIDLDKVFPGTTPVENAFRSTGNQMRFVKSSFVGDVLGSTTQPDTLARFQLVALGTLTALPDVAFTGGESGTVLGLVGKGDPLDNGETLVLQDPEFTQVARGQINATVELEGREPSLGDDDHSTLLDVHLRRPGSTIDLIDSNFRTKNDDFLATSDTIEVTTATDGSLMPFSVPAGRYVLTFKDTSHVSGRTDTFTVRNGQILTIGSTITGLFGSDLRGDPTTLLEGSPTGRRLKAGDATEDNEINEDDVNFIIAAWSTSPTASNFRPEADMNNDDMVTAADLTVTTSNFGNSEGFGAPPVYKPVTKDHNGDAFLEIEPLFDGRRPLLAGQEIELDVHAKGLQDLAGYEFNLHFDPSAMRLLPQRVEDGGIFAPNPDGAVFDIRPQQSAVGIMAARIGKRWSAEGDGTMARLRFEVLQAGPANVVIEELRIASGVLLNTIYDQETVNWTQELSQLLLPSRPDLEQNYPNPFNPSTVIPFSLSSGQEVRLFIYNVLGQKIRTLIEGPMDPGYHRMLWNGSSDSGRQVAAGVYFYLLETPELRQTRKMLLVK